MALELSNPEPRPVRLRIRRALGGIRPIAGAAFVLATVLALTAGSAGVAVAGAEKAVPWSVRLDVHWGEKRNREVYRSDFQAALRDSLRERSCFSSVREEPKADLVLEVQLNDFVTEQEYDSPSSLMPGQGEFHTLRVARAKVKLEYRLLPGSGEATKSIIDGHFYREAAREPQSPTDPAEERALRGLTLDAARWIVREICEHHDKLQRKIESALGAAPPAPASGPP